MNSEEEEEMNSDSDDSSQEETDSESSDSSLEEEDDDDDDEFGENIPPFNEEFPPQVIPLPESYPFIRPLKKYTSIQSFTQNNTPNTPVLVLVKEKYTYAYVVGAEVRIDEPEEAFVIEEVGYRELDLNPIKASKYALKTVPPQKWYVPVEVKDVVYKLKNVITCYSLTVIDKDLILKYFRTKTFKKGQKLYHGTHDLETNWHKIQNSLNKPLFLATEPGDAEDYGTILTFVLKKDITVIDLESNEWDTGVNGRHSLRFLVSGLKMRSVPKEELSSKDSDALWVCNLGIAGWTSSDYDLMSGVEIMICNPKEYIQSI